MCAFDTSGLEAILARLRSGNDASMFGHVSLWSNVGRGVLYFSCQVLFSSFLVVAPVAVGQAWLLFTAGFAKCVCQDFTNCRFLMVFNLCCQALAQDAGAHGQRASQALKFLVDHFLCCQSCSMFCRCFGRPLSLDVACIAARHLLDVTRDESDAVLMTFIEIP